MSRHTPPPEVAPYRHFMRLLPLTLVAAMLLWLLVRPALDTSVSWLAETLVRAFEYPRVTQVVAVDHRAQVRRADFRSGSAIPTVSLTEVHFNTIVLLALALALPRPWSRRRLERLVMAWSILWVTQGLNLVFHVKTLYAVGLGEWSQQHYGDVARNVYGFLQYFTDLPGRFSFPFLLWIAFCWDAVAGLLPDRVGAPPAEPAQRPRRRK